MKLDESLVTHLGRRSSVLLYNTNATRDVNYHVFALI